MIDAGLSNSLFARVLHVRGIAAKIIKPKCRPTREGRAVSSISKLKAGSPRETSRAGPAIRAIVRLVVEAARFLDRRGAILFGQSNDGRGTRPGV